MFQWSDSTGGKSYLSVKPLTKGDSREKVDVAGVTIGRMQLRKIHEVTTGEGVTSFGSEGHYKSENKGARSYSLQEMTYKWEAHVNPQRK